MTTYQRNTVHTSEDIRAIADHAGSPFFSDATMRFFSSRLLSGVYAGQASHEASPGNVFFFVTSERYGEDSPRHYTVRKITLKTTRDNRPGVDISTANDTRYWTAGHAHKAARDIANH